MCQSFFKMMSNCFLYVYAHRSVYLPKLNPFEVRCLKPSSMSYAVTCIRTMKQLGSSYFCPSLPVAFFWSIIIKAAIYKHLHFCKLHTPATETLATRLLIGLKVCIKVVLPSGRFLMEILLLGPASTQKQTEANQ